MIILKYRIEYIKYGSVQMNIMRQDLTIKRMAIRKFDTKKDAIS